LAKYSKAVDYFLKAIELNSNEIDYYHNIAIAYSGIDQTDLAVKYYKKTL